MLDSNVIIALTMNTNAGVTARAAACDEGDLVTSAIAYAEIVHGSVRNQPPGVEQLRAFVEEVAVLDFDFKAALAYASIPFKRGRYDRLIAAHALSHDLIMVTRNVADYADIPALRVENWHR